MAEIRRRDALKLGGLALGGLGAASVIGGRKAIAEPAQSPPAEDLQMSRTEVMLLSGTGKDDAVDWQFMCTSGANFGVWTTIPVPSNWELHGFGTYAYQSLSPGEKGLYKREFTPPPTWQGKRIFIVFEGVMTDTEVSVNGSSAGDIHQGGFYRFGYEISDLVHWPGANLLEVTASKDSSNASVNGAERLGDYWNFGGIYRPVYLEARPAEYIDRVAIDARADGSFAMDVYLAGITDADHVVAQITGPINSAARRSGPVGAAFSAQVSAGTDKVTMKTTARDPRLWTAETPELYGVEVRLLAGSQEVHRISQNFGFRTVELRDGDGIYVNGTKVMLRGVGRHSFWPDSGRALSPRISRDDILLMKQMNVNAVRMTHYPPDQHFLDYADSLGLYVLDELAGWQHAYDTPTARRLVQEMVVRDVNHPSIIFWDNANEGGWNTAVDGDFALYDPQARRVLHPGGGTFDGIRDVHYPTYTRLQGDLQASTVVLPTEFLHALYDGGGGSGLADYWASMTQAPLGAGGFIWDFVDGGVVRVDRGNIIDTNGNFDADGVLGPYRQKEGSFFAIKDIWSPIQLADPRYLSNTLPADFDGEIDIVNRYSFTNADQCRFEWSLIQFEDPSSARSGHRVIDSGVAGSRGGIAPGQTGSVRLTLPAGLLATSDALTLRAVDPSGNELYTWVWTTKKATDYRTRIVRTVGPLVSATEGDTDITMAAGGTEVVINKTTGLLSEVRRDGATISLSNGPVLSTGSSSLVSLQHGPDGKAYVVRAQFSGDMQSCTWRLFGSGWLQLDYQYHLDGQYDFFGVNFDYPEALVSSIDWLGRGPYRVYKNRTRGVTMDVWTKEYNDTETGARLWNYPEFRGYYADTYWAKLQTVEANITVVAEDEELFLRLFTPVQGADHRTARAAYPDGDISFLDAISAMGTKFNPPGNLGPESQQNTATGDYARTLYFSFEPPEKFSGSFSIAASPQAQSIAAGSSCTYEVRTATVSGSPGPINLTATGAPSGVSVSFDPATVVPGHTALMTVSTTGSVASGRRDLTISGQASTGGVSASTQVALIVVRTKITDLVVADAANAGDWSIQWDLGPGDTLYGDRTFAVVSLPQVLVGADWIRAANDSKTATENPLVTFTLVTPATVAVAVDTRVGRLSWMDSSWKDTGTQIIDSEGGNVAFEVFTKDFPAGTVALGPQSVSNSSMYVVAAY